jgi:hypothetical protein
MGFAMTRQRPQGGVADAWMGRQSPLRRDLAVETGLAPRRPPNRAQIIRNGLQQRSYSIDFMK